MQEPASAMAAKCGAAVRELVAGFSPSAEHGGRHGHPADGRGKTGNAPEQVSLKLEYKRHEDQLGERRDVSPTRAQAVNPRNRARNTRAGQDA